MTEHRHDWQPYGEEWACQECAETCPSCIVTHKGESHPTGCALLICDPCVMAEGRVLDLIVQARDAIVIEPRSLVPAYAYDVTNAHSTDPERLPYGLDRVTDDPDFGVQGIRTDGGVDDELWGWVALWSESAGAENTDHTDYLKGRLIWAAHNGAGHFLAYRRAMRELLGRVRALGAPEVEKAGPHCLDCGGALVREWMGDGTERDPKKRGLGDAVKCESCLRDYDDVTYRLAFRAKVEREGDPSTLMTEPELRQALMVGSSTIRVWITRGRLTHAGVRRGQRLYRLGDARTLAYGDTPNDEVVEGVGGAV